MKICRHLLLSSLALAWAAPTSADVRGATIVATVRNPAGDPVRDAVVEAEIENAKIVSRSDAHGIALLASVPPGSVILSVVAKGFDTWHGRENAVAGEVINTRVALQLVNEDGSGSRASGDGGSYWDARNQLKPDKALGAFANEWSLLETVEPAAVTDRIDGAGLYLGDWARYAMHGSSWTQNNVLLGGLDITDPARGGNPIAYPDMNAIDTIDFTTALAPVEYSAPGVTMALTPREPAHQWYGRAEGRWVPHGLQAKPKAGDPPSIARLGALGDVGALVSGPIAGQRLRMLLSARGSRMRRFERNRPEELSGWAGSLSGHLVYQATDRDMLRLVASAQALKRPFAGRPRFQDLTVPEHGDFFRGQLRWEHTGERRVWSVFAGLQTGLLRHPDECDCDRPIERLLDGPVPEIVYALRSRRTTWTVGAEHGWTGFRALGAWHAPRFGATVGGTASRERPESNHFTAELVDGIPARVWDYGYVGPESRRRTFDLGAYAADRFVFGDRLFVEGGLRLDATSGKARGAVQGITWRTISPRVSARLRLTNVGQVSLLGGYGEYRHRLRMDALAFGDPAGPQGSVYRWRDRNGDGFYTWEERGELIAVVGPGSRDGLSSTIDPKLKPPRTRELVAGIEAKPGQAWVVRLSAFDRRERNLIESINVGAPASAYDVSYIPDPAGDLLGAQDDQMLPVYARRADSFGLDRYVLTNPAGDKAEHQGVELRVQGTFGDRLRVLLGGTAFRSDVFGGNRGFHAFENDQGVIGELYDNPNAATHAFGRSFFDRAYVLKTSLRYRTPGDVLIGSVARYQDGQPFARYVVVADLPQGAEAIPAVPRGQIAKPAAMDDQGRYIVPSGHRFAYTLTWDARLEKRLRVGHRRVLSLSVEAFNLLGLRREVEERVVSGPGFRAVTVIQPPRSFGLGASYEF